MENEKTVKREIVRREKAVAVAGKAKAEVGGKTVRRQT